MNKLALTLTGIIIGSGIGYVAGSLLADYLCAEEYLYTTEEKDYNNTMADTPVFNQARFDRTAKKDKTVINYVEYYTPKQKEDLAKLVKKYREGADEELKADVDPKVDEWLADQMPVIVTDTSKPFMITEKEFNTTGVAGQEDVILYYYALDDIVTATDDVVIDRPEQILGEEALTKFDSDRYGDIVYVRNLKLAGDYKVIRYQESYAEEILGLKEEPRHTKKVRNRNEETE